MTMMISKLMLLLVVSIAVHCATTPPNGPPPAEELREQGLSERAIPYFTVFVKVLVWSWAALELSVLFVLGGICPPALARPVLDALMPGFDSATTLTPTFVAGVLLTVSGSLLRTHAYRVLGPRFTFELSIRRPAPRNKAGAAHHDDDDDATTDDSSEQAHTLVTDGIYGVVRHPSYTGAVAVAVGYLCCLLDPHTATVSIATRIAVVHVGLPAAVRVETAQTAVLACVWTAVVSVFLAGCQARMDREDAMLEKHFGEAWRVWAGRVRWRLVPGVY